MVSVRNVKSISYLARWLVPLPFALTRKTVVKAARNARYLRVSRGPSANVISLLWRRRRAVRWALKRDRVTSGRELLYEKRLFRILHTHHPIFRPPPAESSCLRARNAAVSWRVAVRKKEIENIYYALVAGDNGSYYARRRDFFTISNFSDIFFKFQDGFSV